MDADVAIELAPSGSYILERTLRLEVTPDVVVTTCAIRTPTGVLIPLHATLPNGGKLELLATVDVENYLAAMNYARDRGGLPTVAALLERFTGHRARPLLAR